MADDELKVYTADTIPDVPFPSEEGVSFNETNPTGDTPGATKISDQPLPAPRVAKEIISNAINSVSRKILAVWEFTKFGAIQIGEYIAGESGDVRISPDGITARNKNGENTFAIDGTTGDALFKGTVQAGATIVANTIITEQSSTGNGRTVYYNDGIPAIVIGDVP